MNKSGSPVHKLALLDEVWPDSVVEEQVVFQSVKELRQLFHGNEVIKTIPKQGYVWLPDVDMILANEAPVIRQWLAKFVPKKIVLMVLLLLVFILYLASHFLFSDDISSNKIAQLRHDNVTGSVVILPTTNQIEGNDHSWIRLGFMDQIIQRLPNDSTYGVLQTDYVLEVLERAKAPLNNVGINHISDIFQVSGADLIVSTKLSGTPHDYQLSYTVFRQQFKQQGVLFSKNTQTLVDELSLVLARLLGNKIPLSAEQYHADFHHQMLGVAIDFRLEGNHDAALPLLQSIVDKDPENLTAQRLLIESLFALGSDAQVVDRLETVLSLAHQSKDSNERVRLMFFKAISLMKQEQYQAANNVISTAIKVAKQNDDWLYQAYLSDLLAQIAIEQHDFDLAEKHFQQSMRYHQVLKCPVGETNSWINLAFLAKQQNQKDKQNRAFSQAREIATKRNLTNQINFLKKISQ